jgi:hypothetical protein
MSCFIFQRTQINVNDFLNVLMADPGPQCLMWLPILNKMTHVENGKFGITRLTKVNYHRLWDLSLGHVKPKTIKLIFAASPLSMHHLGTKTDYLRIRITCWNGATCLSMDCCFSELALIQKSN